MAWLREFVRRFRFLVWRDRVNADLEEEMRLHLELREARLRERGAAPLEAYYAARKRFGNPIHLQQRSRDMWGLTWLDDLAVDLRFAARRLRRRPGFAAATILVAALGIGATTAVFSAVDAAFIRPLPFARPDELVTLNNLFVPLDLGDLLAVHTPPTTPGGSPPPQPAPKTLDYAGVATMHDLFSGVGAYAAGGLNLADAANPRRVRVGVVTANFFSLLGAFPGAGRTFNEAEGRPHGPHSVVLSEALWRDAFGAADLVGRSIDLSGTPYTVIGIMRRGFGFPNESELWIPLTVPATAETFAPFRGFLPTFILARVAPGVTAAVANARLLDRWQQIVGAPASDHARTDAQLADMRAHGTLTPLQRQLVGDRRQALIILMSAAALLLFIASANVANLLLSDAASRRREVALREVLGASGARIVRQLLAESLLIALAGAALGVASAPVALRLIRALMPSNLAGVVAVDLNSRVLIFAVALAIATALAFGLWPALGTARTDPGETIKSGGSGATAGSGRTRRVLVTIEVALTAMLLVASGLMIRSLDRVLTQQLGMNPEHVATLQLSFSAGRRAGGLVKVHEILDRLAVDPGMNGAGIVNDLPLRGSAGMSISINVDGAPPPTSVDQYRFARYLMASSGYFKAMGIPLLRGHLFPATDDSLSPRTAVISETMAKRFWPNADPLGKTFHTVWPEPITIIGIVADVRELSLESDARPQMYFSVDRETPSSLAIVARSTLDPAVMLARLRDAVRSVDPTQAVYDVRTMDDVIATSVAPRRTNTTLIAIFGAIALALAAFGVYAVVSYSVARRAREFGIRAALGATGRNIAMLVGREMAWTIVLGLALGLGGAWGLVHILASMLYGIDPHDAVSFAAAPLLLIVPAAVATLVPARRAMRVDPTEVMRAE